MQSILEDFEWGRYKRVLDVGGAHGAVLAAIMNHQPGVTGVLFDQPQVHFLFFCLKLQISVLALPCHCPNCFLRGLPGGAPTSRVAVIVLSSASSSKHQGHLKPNIIQTAILVLSCQASKPVLNSWVILDT